MNRVLLPEGWPRPKGYSNGIEATGRMVFVAGQIGWDTTGAFPDGFAAQFRQTIDNTLAVLAEAGAGPEHIVRMTWYVVDKAEYLAALRDVGAVWRERIGPHYPAMAVVEDWFAGPLEASFRELHLERRVSVPTAAVEARFIAPSRLEDDLTFSLAVTKLGGASCGLRHVIESAGQRRFEATQTIVFVGRSMKPELWPEPLRARIQPFLEVQP